jgi:hypothetical protein
MGIAWKAPADTFAKRILRLFHARLGPFLRSGMNMNKWLYTDRKV